MNRYLAWIAAGIAAALLLVMLSPALSTWRPEYANSPKAVQDWFKAATVAGWEQYSACRAKSQTVADCAHHSPAHIRLGIANCCEEAERLKTKFVSNAQSEWAYYPDPACVTDGCALLPIPNDIVHDKPIRALDPKDNNLPEFEQMRREGVLFIYQGKPSCFWAPKGGG